MAFLLVVAPRNIVFHLNSPKEGMTSKQALIEAGLAVQNELGVPTPGTYRHRFYGDEKPRRYLGDDPGPPRRRGPAVPDDERAVAALARLPEGVLHDMRFLPGWLRRELEASVKRGGLRE